MPGLFGAGGSLDLFKRLAFHVLDTGRDVGEELQIVDVRIGEGSIDGGRSYRGVEWRSKEEQDSEQSKARPSVSCPDLT